MGKKKTTPQCKSSNNSKNSQNDSSAVKRPKLASAASQNWKSLGLKPTIPAHKRMQQKINNNKRGDIKRKEETQSGVAPTPTVQKRFVPFSSIPNENLNSFGMIDYDLHGKIKTLLPSNIAPHVMNVTPAVGLDCEFVDIGVVLVREFTLARISVVNEYGYQLYHAFVKPKVPVQDYLTKFSGVRQQDLVNGVELEEVQKVVCKILEGKILVGHSIDHDLKVLKINHPRLMIRDTARFFRKVYRRSPPLKLLVKDVLGVEIQQGEHQPTEDAQAAMKIYLKNRATWEKLHRQKVYKLPVEKKSNDIKNK